jgi:N-acetylmuramoyl-L-alanine amidase
VCNQVNYPSSLVEVGFCTNPNDAEKMVNDAWQEKFAQSLADGIDAYFTEYAE